MKNNLLSIGEVSKLKGVGIKSLRYYERIGIFKPSYTNPTTGYRYYSMNQMLDLDIIATCIELGIPLKDLEEYQNENGSLDLTSLLERGKSLAEARIRESQAILTQMDTWIDEAKAQQSLASAPSPYRKTEPERLVLCLPWPDGAFRAKKYAHVMTDLYELAKSLDIIPLYFQGFIHDPNGELEHFSAGSHDARKTHAGGEWYAHVEVQLPDGGARSSDDGITRGRYRKESARDEQKYFDTLIQRTEAAGARLLAIPETEFEGRRLRGTFEECFEEVFACMRQANGLVIADEIWDAELDPNSFVVELLTKTD